MEESSIDPGFIDSLSGIKSIGRYEIVKKLGRGGAGIVFLARDPYIKRDVAIKVAQIVFFAVTIIMGIIYGRVNLVPQNLTKFMDLQFIQIHYMFLVKQLEHFQANQI